MLLTLNVTLISTLNVNHIALRLYEWYEARDVLIWIFAHGMSNRIYRSIKRSIHIQMTLLIKSNLHSSFQSSMELIILL